MGEKIEIFKGIFIFIFGNIFFYVAWYIFSNVLDFAITENVVIGSMAWVSFILVWVGTCVIYPIYAIVKGTSGSGETNMLELMKGTIFWFIGTLSSILIYYAGGYVIEAINGMPNDAANTVGTVEILGWFFILIIYVGYMIILPGTCYYNAFTGEGDE